MSPPSRIPLVQQLEKRDPRKAVIIDAQGEYNAGELLARSTKVATHLLNGAGDLAQERVAFLMPASIDYVTTQWAIWRAGGIAVPLCTMHPPAELMYVIENSDASIVMADAEYAELLAPIAEKLGRRFVRIEDALKTEAGTLPEVEENRAAMIIYTSGTTSKPKGVITTHRNLSFQISSLIEAWGWTSEDRLMLVLPLHHVHGVVNVLCCALWAGATCDMLPSFQAGETWSRLLEGKQTLFMAVPTVYSRLIKAWEAAPAEERKSMTEACEKLRLMVCGSAALPLATLHRWREISGHTLLERYGMTELGMALSNPLKGDRRAGFVGSPLPYVHVRLVDESHQPVPEGTSGEIQVRGETVFREYWRKPEDTEKAFVDGWFRTGDIAICDQGDFRILGRNSVDIIKTGGYKVSALEIEDELRSHDSIDQCAVVGLEDAEWGERVAAAVVLKPDTTLDLESLRTWTKSRLATYKVPSRLLLVDELPRNAMGKVVKPELVKLF